MHVTDHAQYDKHLRRPPYLSSLKKIVERRNLQASINILPPVSSHFRQTQTSTHTPSILPLPSTHPSTHALPYTYTHARAQTERGRDHPWHDRKKQTQATLQVTGFCDLPQLCFGFGVGRMAEKISWQTECKKWKLSTCRRQSASCEWSAGETTGGKGSNSPVTLNLLPDDFPEAGVEYPEQIPSLYTYQPAISWQWNK